MNLQSQIKQRVSLSKPETLTRIKIGRAINAIALLPIGTSILHLVAIPMMLPISPTLWAKDKIINFKVWMVLR